MKIDEIVKELEDSKDYPTSDPASDEALDGAINIIHKYQKIEEIYKNWSYGADSCDCMKDIERVVEDGND